MTDDADRQKTDAWVGMLAVVNTVLRTLETEMLERHGLPMTWFDVLNRLDQAPGGRLRMHEIESVSVFTRSGITRLADRMEEAGLVRRERVAGDRRGIELSLTEAGVARLRDVWPDHLRGIRQQFGDRITTADAHAILAATAKITAPVRSRMLD